MTVIEAADKLCNALHAYEHARTSRHSEAGRLWLDLLVARDDYEDAREQYDRAGGV